MPKPLHPARRRAEPLDSPRLTAIALHYVGRYATTETRLSRYLKRKLAERGWDDSDEPDVAGLGQRFAALGYIDNDRYAENKASGLSRRGYGPRRIAAALIADGFSDDAAKRLASSEANDAWDAADRFARRKRIGPYAVDPVIDPALRERQLAAFVRAGHSFATARRFVDCPPGSAPERDPD